jgi:hypothetical protein
MNKRIQKLFNEAGFHQPEMKRLGIEDKFEKFAELIVRKCADVVKETRWAVPPSQEQIARGIQQHFGVEE